MSRISDALRHRVRERAGYRCEYCQSHQDYLMGWLQVDHIWPVSRGGTDVEDNLCLACELCNQYKWNQTTAIDPATRIECLLFNPRQQVWQQHFTWSVNGTEIIGLTDCGRATVEALKLNNPLAVRVRGHWVTAGWHPPGLGELR